MFISDDGIRLSLEPEKPEGFSRGPLVILLHGFTSSKDRPHNILAAEAMREAGYATVRMDLYGHGESGGEFRKHTLWKWVSNVMAVISWARSLDSVTDIYLSGHSQGGLAAAMAAGMAPDRISGLILRAPAFLIPRGAREGSLLGRSFDPDHIPDAIQVIKGLTLDGEYIRVARTVHAEEYADRFKGPVLILHGDHDDTVPVDDSAEFAKRYADCELAVIPGETHHFDTHPDIMKEKIRAFCERILHTELTAGQNRYP